MAFNFTVPTNYTYSNLRESLTQEDEETPFRKARRTNSSNSLSDTRKLRNESTCSNSASDLESLPDLTDDDDNWTPESSPIKPPSNHRFIFLESPSTKSFNLKQQPPATKLSIFHIPEIVYKIVSFVDIQNTQLPSEATVIRRKPTSYKHALLIYGDKDKAKAALESSTSIKQSSKDPMLNCLLINKLFNKITREIMSTKLYFTNEIQLLKYIESNSSITFQNPTNLNLHKLFHLKNSNFLKLISNIQFHKLQSLELFMCPKLQPPSIVLQQSSQFLQKIIITGSKIIDDEFCYQISLYCKNLKHLDLRGCELITDSGLYFIFQNNFQLTYVNIGRKNKNHLITDQSIHYLVKNNTNLDTLGLAGTYISDNVLWEISQSLPQLKRLSLNNCRNLTNSGINRIFNNNSKILPQLNVLELCYNYQIMDLTQLIKFKNFKNNLNGIGNNTFILELCEQLLSKYRDQEFQLDKITSISILDDISYYINN
ncbi:AMN1 [Candida pseudojiufengensis]|uniref:AMN1 n=1 Tax=Candida pseudojiufengensis TaxID=497109 RepID=UPI00222477DB|nr:AMN1 [Candida pseudojiufengensis]KAI5958975.1 AMN1 [Candida pseudojiufengensis]